MKEFTITIEDKGGIYMKKLNSKDAVFFPMGGCYLDKNETKKNREMNPKEAILFPMGGCYLNHYVNSKKRAGKDSKEDILFPMGGCRFNR